MTVSVVSICNLALTRIGQPQIASLSASGKAADLCNLHYEPTRDAVLRDHPWNFAIAYAELARSSTTPAFEFDYTFTLPTDCIKVLRTEFEQLGYDGSTYAYRIVGREIFANTETLAIEYTKRVTDPTQFDAMFVDMLAERLAAELAYPLTDNRSLVETRLQIYQNKLAAARLADAQEGTPREVVALDPWIVARV
jgi:hypothetical protein